MPSQCRPGRRVRPPDRVLRGRRRTSARDRSAGRSPRCWPFNSGGPGERGLGEAGLALIGDAESVDPGPLRLSHRQVRSNRMEHTLEADRLTGFHPERDDVLDIELNRVTDPNAVPQTVVADLNRRPLDPQDLAYEGSKRAHGSAQLPAKYFDQLIHLLV